MKTIIAGSRTITNLAAIQAAVNLSGFQITEVVCGCARGADSVGREWARLHRIPVRDFPADWDTHGKGAGFRRNIDMARYADALVLVWDGKSKGSAHMLEAATKRGLKVYQHII